jgi:hypothetical protein
MEISPSLLSLSIDMRFSIFDRTICLVCDYGLVALVFILVFLLGFLQLQNKNINPPSITSPVATTAIATPTIVSTPIMLSTLQPAFTQVISFPVLPTLIPSPEKPEFILVFVPVNWGLSQSEFQQAAQAQSDIFINESDIENYFTVTVVALKNGVENASLGSDTLVYDMQEFALQEQAGNRYIGLTDGDLSPEGDSNVVGWTSGGSAMVAEYQDKYVVTHELGHTFGLCDEYSYSDWSRQNEAYDGSGGCPNPYPKDCPHEESDEPICNGAPASDGSNSIMGPAGLPGDYSFNKKSKDHLQEVFQGYIP